MDETVAVGLVTSASTLLAVGLTGVVSIWIARGQLRHQERLASAQSREQRAARHRDVRREAYVRFLARVDDAYRRLDQRWSEPPPAVQEPARTDPVYLALRALDGAHNLVLLEGPEAVGEQAHRVIKSVDQEYRDQRRVRDSRAGASEGAAQLEPARHAAAIAARVKHRAEFMAVARPALGGDLPPTLPPTLPLTRD